MTAPAKAPAKSRASRSGNPATAAAAKRDAEAKADAAREAQLEQARLQEAQAAKLRAEFNAMTLPAPVFDDEGYEVIPEAEGGAYKFKINGHPFILPKLSHLPLAVAQQLQAAKTEEEAQALIFERYVPDLYEHASQADLFHVMKRWMDYSKGVGLGE